MRYLVTGATGFIGRALVSELLAAGHEVTSVVRREDHALPGDIACMSDPLRAIDYAPFLAGVDTVVNLLAAGVHPGERNPSLLYQANTAFPVELALASAAAGVSSLVHLGSSAEYARPPTNEPLLETSPVEDARLYGSTKAAGSIGVQGVCRAAGVRSAVLRAFNVFGPGEAPHRLFPSVAARIAAGEHIAMSAGTQIRDFIYVDDVCSAIERVSEGLASDRIEPGIYNLASGNGVTVGDFASLVAEVVGGRQEQLELGAIPMRPDDLPYVVSSQAKLESAIGPLARRSLQESIELGVSAMGIERVRR